MISRCPVSEICRLAWKMENWNDQNNENKGINTDLPPFPDSIIFDIA